MKVAPLKWMSQKTASQGMCDMVTLNTSNTLNPNGVLYGTSTTTGINIATVQDYFYGTMGTHTYGYDDNITRKPLTLEDHMAIHYVVSIDGHVLPLGDITKVKTTPFKDIDGMYSALSSEETPNPTYTVYVKNVENDVFVVDFTKNNDYNFQDISSYDSDRKKKVFLHQVTKMRNKACKVKSDEV